MILNTDSGTAVGEESYTVVLAVSIVNVRCIVNTRNTVPMTTVHVGLTALDYT